MVKLNVFYDNYSKLKRKNVTDRINILLRPKVSRGALSAVAFVKRQILLESNRAIGCQLQIMTICCSHGSAEANRDLFNVLQKFVRTSIGPLVRSAGLSNEVESLKRY